MRKGTLEKKYDDSSPGLNVNEGNFKNRLLISTPMTGLVRSEWVAARYNQTIPTNWSQVEFTQLMHSHIPLRYQVADAENISAKMAVEKGFEWLLFIEHDNLLQPGTFVRLNEYMIEKKVPVVAGLYFTKSDPPEPLVYRDFGWGHYRDWKMGDKIWCKGIPFGLTLIHGSILKVLWDESPEYVCSGQILRRMFQAADNEWWDPNLGIMNASSGTSDLQFCERLIKDRIFEKAGWPEYQKKEHPFLIDTNLFCYHISDNGLQFPLGGIPERYMPKNGKNGHSNGKRG